MNKRLRPRESVPNERLLQAQSVENEEATLGKVRSYFWFVLLLTGLGLALAWWGFGTLHERVLSGVKATTRITVAYVALCTGIVSFLLTFFLSVVYYNTVRRIKRLKRILVELPKPTDREPDDG